MHVSSCKYLSVTISKEVKMILRKNWRRLRVGGKDPCFTRTQTNRPEEISEHE